MSDMEIIIACVVAIIIAVTIGVAVAIADERRIHRKYRVRPSQLRDLLDNASRDRWEDR